MLDLQVSVGCPSFVGRNVGCPSVRGRNVGWDVGYEMLDEEHWTQECLMLKC